MSQTGRKIKRNQSLECCRMIAAFFVVIIHTQFPGPMHEFVNCVGRFAMPLFFGISGYFSLGAGSRKLGRRFASVLRLNVIASAACLLLSCSLAVCRGEGLLSYVRSVFPSMRGLSNWLFLNINPFGGHLWYLAAIAVCYGMLWGYVRFFEADQVDYRPLYAVSAALFFIRFAVGDVLRSIGLGIPFYLCRDGLFLGLPMFSLGLFLRQHRDRIISGFSLTPGRLAALFAAGTILSLFQMQGIGTGELPFGAVIQGASMILLCTMRPAVCTEGSVGAKAIASFGFLSTAIYVIHMNAIDAYQLFLEPALGAGLGGLEPWLRPLLVFALTLAAGVLIHQAYAAVRKLLSRT